MAEEQNDTVTEEAAPLPPSQSEADWRVGVEYVGFYARVGAALIDTIAIMLPLSLLFGVLVQVIWGSANGAQEIMMLHQAQGDPQATEQAVNMLLSSGFFQRWMVENLIFSTIAGMLVVGMWYWFSASPGKMVMGMKIVDADTGMPPNNGQNIIRYLGYFVSTLALGFGMFWIAWNDRRQGWHDKMANTVVVYKKSLPEQMAQATLHKE